jgi:hypothetical protein
VTGDRGQVTVEEAGEQGAGGEDFSQSPITNYQLPITNYQLPNKNAFRRLLHCPLKNRW